MERGRWAHLSASCQYFASLVALVRLVSCARPVAQVGTVAQLLSLWG